MLYRFKSNEQALAEELDNWCRHYLPRQFEKHNRTPNTPNTSNTSNTSKWFKLFVYYANGVAKYLAVDNRSTETEFWQSELRQFAAMANMTGLTNVDMNASFGRVSGYNRKVLVFSQPVNLDVPAIIRKASIDASGSGVFFSDTHIVVTALDSMTMLRIALPIQTALDDKPTTKTIKNKTGKAKKL